MSKYVLMFSSSLALGIGAYAAYRYWKKKRESKCVDEGFEDASKLDENPDKRILVLGLERSGKTLLVSCLTKSTDGIHANASIYNGFLVANMTLGDRVLHIWDVAGGDKNKHMWMKYVQDTDLVIFVVDAADRHRLVWAVKEIKTLVGDDRLQNVPIIVVASKQDLTNALTPSQVSDALDLMSISPSKHKVRVLGTQIDKTSIHPSIDALKKTIQELI